LHEDLDTPGVIDALVLSGVRLHREGLVAYEDAEA
jgi:hypothetical protein